MSEGNEKSKIVNAVSWVALIVSIISLLATIHFSSEANSISKIANDISGVQATIQKNSFKPEFIYMGPEEKINSQDTSAPSENSDRYTYGLRPKFARVSGFTEDLSIEAHSHYEIEFIENKYAIDYENGFSYSSHAPTSKIAFDVYGDFFDQLFAFEDGCITVALNETGAKFSPKLIAEKIEKRGYRTGTIVEYCVGELTYKDVKGEACRKPFVLDLKAKRCAEFGTSHDDCCDGYIRLDYDWELANHGITDEVIESLAEDVYSQLAT